MTIAGPGKSQWFGEHARIAGDVNKDGSMDIVVGAPGDDTKGPRAGRAWVYSNKFAFILGSMNGTKPGTSFGSVTLPLNLDSYFMFTAANPNTLIDKSFSLLDRDGTGTARFILPRGLPAALAGLRLHHAFLAFSVNPLSFDFGSNSVPLAIVK